MSNEGKRYVFTWNRDRIPDPREMTRTFHDSNIQTIANIKPAMLTTLPLFNEAVSLFIKKSDEDVPGMILINMNYNNNNNNNNKK
jgi:alpha-glucosidase